MRKSLLIWGVPALIYLAFCVWYTNLSGPITPDEAETYLSYFEGQNDNPERLSQLRRFMEEDDGDDFIMINLLDMKDIAGPVGDLGEEATGDDAMARYMDYMWPSLLSRASHPVLFGPTISDAMDVVGLAGVRSWTTGAAMRYRSRRDMMDVATNPAFSGAHFYKVAALDMTIAVPITHTVPLSDPRLLLFFLLLSVAGVVNAFVRR